MCWRSLVSAEKWMDKSCGTRKPSSVSSEFVSVKQPVTSTHNPHFESPRYRHIVRRCRCHRRNLIQKTQFAFNLRFSSFIICDYLSDIIIISIFTSILLTGLSSCTIVHSDGIIAIELFAEYKMIQHIFSTSLWWLFVWRSGKKKWNSCYWFVRLWFFHSLVAKRTMRKMHAMNNELCRKMTNSLKILPSFLPFVFLSL